MNLKNPQTKKSFFTLLLKASLGVFLALWVLFEEVVWDYIVALARKCKNWTWVVGMKSMLLSVQSPWLAAACFLVPMLAMLPINVCGGWLVKHGHYGAGVSILITMKITGTAIFASMFDVLKHVLNKWAWFEHGFQSFLNWKARVIAFAKETSAYTLIMSGKAKMKAIWKVWKKNHKPGAVWRWWKMKK